MLRLGSLLGFLLLAMGLAAPLPAGAQQSKDDLVRQLAPAQSRGLTRGLKRQIVVEPADLKPGNEDEVLKKTRELPSVNIRVSFGYDSDVLTPEGVATLKPLGAALQDERLRGGRFLIGGHTDARGSDAYNQALSERRARSVREHLIATYGIAPDKLVAMGFGKRQPLDAKDPENGANRRVEVINLTQ